MAETNVQYESGIFGAGGYSWKLVFYPNGNKKKNAKDHISLYLVKAVENSLQPGEEVYVDFRLFLLDQIKNKYLVIEDAFKRNFCFRGETSGAVGFDKLVSLKDFTDASNGYLIDDACVFGAEVFVCNGTRRIPPADCLSTSRTISKKYKHTWKVANFSNLAAQYYEKRFTAGGHHWRIKLYPDVMGARLGLYLGLADPEKLPHGTKISTNFTLRILDQLHGNHYSRNSVGHIVMSGTGPDWGWTQFITLGAFRREANGYLRSDTFFVEAEFTVARTATVLNTLGKNDTDIQEGGNDFVQRFSKGSHILSVKKIIMKKSSTVKQLIGRLLGH